VRGGEEVRCSAQLFFSAVRTPNCSGVRLSCTLRLRVSEADDDFLSQRLLLFLRAPRFLKPQAGAA
jgi:hypothetical protein